MTLNTGNTFYSIETNTLHYSLEHSSTFTSSLQPAPMVMYAPSTRAAHPSWCIPVSESEVNTSTSSSIVVVDSQALVEIDQVEIGPGNYLWRLLLPSSV